MGIRVKDSFASAYRYYQRLCTSACIEPDGQTLNRISALSILREALQSSPQMKSLLGRLATIEGEATAEMLADTESPKNIAAVMVYTEHYGLVVKRVEKLGSPTGGWRMWWRLSPLGQLVMQQTSDDDVEGGV